MLDVSAIHPFEACAAFAVRFMRHLAGSDLAAAEALLDVNETGIPFADSFLPPVPGPGGFSYADPDQISDWYYVCRADKKGMRLEFEVPFAEAKFCGRSLSARFELRRVGKMLEVRLYGAVPK